MILKWKTILTNWMNCYSSESEKRELNITPTKLLNIFTHIHESIGLDDSKSSKFEANTIKDFIVEKYPEFKFENESLEATCEEELYIMASLLLFFICVNSKNAEIKRVMCSKLSAGDQETIMKFSKCLMDCSPVLHADVEAAIAEACEDAPVKVAETPPALRSLHGEVRRLQAALDAERFDRNYLQDELTRTNLKLEKLTKVKEQYKLDILSLKAQISLCCGGQRESHREARADEFIGRLQRQLHELEGRLEDTLSLLEDVQQERDTYKTKVSDIKKERDKWLSLSQQESDKACHFADQLDIERRSVASLRELVSELRQHNRNNGMDSSMLECDDPDTSVQSLNNLSMCTEVCANVIEVQLGEERAKIETLKQQIQSLEEQLANVNQNFESEKLSLESVITEKENNLVNLKHYVKKEVEEKNTLKMSYEHEIDKLNKIISETKTSSKQTIEEKNIRILEMTQTISSLQQQIADEMEKSSNVIKNLQKEVKEQNTLKIHIEQVNVELNNKILELSQTIQKVEETSKRVLQEKEQGIQSLLQKLEDKATEVKNLQNKIKELTNLQMVCQQETLQLNNKVAEMSQQVKEINKNWKLDVNEKVQKIQSLQQKLTEQVEQSDSVIKKLQNEFEEQNNINTHCEQDIAKLNNTIVEMSLSAQAAEEFSKQAAEEKVQEMQTLQHKYSLESREWQIMTVNLKREIEEENNLKNQYEHEHVKLVNKIGDMSQEIRELKENSILVLEQKRQEIQSLQNKFVDQTDKLNIIINDLQKSIHEQNIIKKQCDQEIIILNDRINEMLIKIKSEKENSKHNLVKNSQKIQSLKKKFADETKKSNATIENLQRQIEEQGHLKKDCDQEIDTLKKKIHEMRESIKVIEDSSKHALEQKVQEIETLKQHIANKTEKYSGIIYKLKDDIDKQNSLKCHHEQEILSLNNKVLEMSQIIKDLEQAMKLSAEEKVQEIQSLQQMFANENETSSKIIHSLQKDVEECNNLKNRYQLDIVVLNNKIDEMNQIIKNIEECSKAAFEEKEEIMQQLQKEFTDEKIKNKILNKEILEAIDLKKRCDQEIVLLNKKVVEMADTIDNTELALKKREQEKHSLQQQLANEVQKSLNKIKNINDELESEKHNHHETKETFANIIVKLNEKDLIHNNELVEMKMQVKQKDELIEVLKSDLKKEKEQRDELISNLLNLNHQKVAVETEFAHLQKNQKNIMDKHNKEVNNLNTVVANLEEKCQNITIEKQKEIDKLNKKIHEISETNKELDETSRQTLEEKVLKIQTLHQQFAAENGKLENIVKNLKIELEAEKYAQMKLKDDFDNRIMKLNEKVLNRNNELVELQNKIIQKSGLIEIIQSDLKREKELREELSNACNDQLLSLNEQKNAAETDMEQKVNEVTMLQTELQEKEMCVNKLSKEIENLSATISNIEAKCRHRDDIIKEKQKDIEFVNDVFQNEQEKLNHKIDEYKASMNSLQMQLQNEIEYKIQLQRELSDLQKSELSLAEELKTVKNLTNIYEENGLLWEKQKNEMKEQIQVNIHKLEILEVDKGLLIKEIETLKDIHNRLTNTNEQMTEEIQADVLKIKKLEDDNALLLKEVEVLKTVQSEEKKAHEEKVFMLEKREKEMSEQILANVLKMKKVEDDNARILKETEALKAVQIKELNDHEEKILKLEKENVEMNQQIQVTTLKIETLENDKVLWMKKIDSLKSVQSKEAEEHAKNMLRWKEQKNELKEQIQAKVFVIEKLKNEITLLLKDMEALKAAERATAEDQKTEMLMWEKEKIKVKKEMEAIALEMEKLEDEKAMLLKDMESVKATHKEEVKGYEEKALMWEKQKNEMKEQIQDNVQKLEKLANEKAFLVKETEAFKADQIRIAKDLEEKILLLVKQNIEVNEEMQANIIKVEQIEESKATLFKEMEALQAIQSRDAKNYQEKTLMVEKLENDNVGLRKDIEALTKEHEYKTILVNNLEDQNEILTKEMVELKVAQKKEIEYHEEKTLMVKKLEDDKAVSIKEMEELKAVQRELTKEQEEKTLLVKNLEDLKEILMKEIEDVKLAQEKEIKKCDEKTFMVKKLEDEKVMLMAEIEKLTTAQNANSSDHEKMKQMWQTQMHEMQQQVQTNVLKVSLLEDEKTMLLQHLEDLKTVESEKSKEYEDKSQIWEKQKTEMTERIQAFVLKVDELDKEKADMLKEIEELTTAQNDICIKKGCDEKIEALEKQEAHTKEKMHTSVLMIEKLEKERVMLSKEVEALKAAQKELLTIATQEKTAAPRHTSWEREIQVMHHQVDTTTSDLTHSSMESLKTISDLEKIIQDKNRKITTMQTEITYIKSMMAESGIKFIDITKELEVCKETCEELSSQLKKTVQQKNEEIAELKRQVTKMSATENRASQIIKVSAKYQAMIIKRIAEIKSNAVLKELTNFGNQSFNGDNETRRSFAGSVTLEDLENFLETTDRHLKRCSEKQITLQKDRDRLTEVNRINESEIINMKKFLTEMSVSFRTFTTVKEVYNQKLSKIVNLQRTVRRDILGLDGRITEDAMYKLERGYAAVMQDLSECSMNLERWVDRSVSRMLSAEKIKQAFTSDLEQATLSTCNYQNAAVEVQLNELENSFQRLLAEIGRAHKGESAKSIQEVTIMEVRAEYEDKLNRMKAKMKELFHEEMGRLKQKQADEVAVLERELVKSKERMTESSRAYEEHIRALTTELWSVGEKFLVKQEENDWLRKKQSGSLMSLQHTHSSGLHTREMYGRASDTHSLRSLPVHNKKTESRGLHMSDEEGEVFDNRFLKELSATPRASLATGQRISELKRRNSLVPAHLKSSYPAEMQFAPTLDEEDIKCTSGSFTLGRQQRKEVGITAYKKPGPPTPSKQAGRLSATDSELRESLRSEPDVIGRKTSTPSRIRSLFRHSKPHAETGTPRSRRFSDIFRKK